MRNLVVLGICGALAQGCGESPRDGVAGAGSGGQPSAGAAGSSGAGLAGSGGNAGAWGGIAGNAASTIRACSADDAGAGGEGGGTGRSPLPSSWRWSSSDPLIAPAVDETHPLLSIKDPSLVYFEDRWHLFATSADSHGAWSMVYASFADFADAATAPQTYLGDLSALSGYHAAPHVFFFAPQAKWYLVFQSGQPQYSTTDDLTQPDTWTTPVNFFAGGEPEIVRDNSGDGTWLDFNVICDDAFCYLFFTDDNGHLYRSRTAVTDFPSGFGEPVIAIEGTKETLFEASQTYRVEGTDQYLTMVEAFGTGGRRYFRSFVADRLDGEWTPLADTFEKPFAGLNNVDFESGNAWTRDISHGELLRRGYDQTPTIAPSCLRFLYQGVDPKLTGGDYFAIPWRLGLLTRTE